jgi:integrase
MQYTIGRLHGRFVVTWTEDGKRRRYRLAARTAAEAESEARDRIRRETLGRGPLTVADVWAAFAAERAGRPVAENLRHTGKSVLPHFGALRPDQITTADCRAYAKARRAAGLADGTIWTHLGQLRSALSWAERMRLIDRAPHIERPSQPAPKDRRLSDDEIARLLAAEAEPHVRLAAILMLTTAGRVTALLELKWERVDFERGRIYLRTPDMLTRKGRGNPPINDTLRAALLTARAAALSPYVVEWAGGPVKSIKKGFASMCRRAKLDDVSPHVLRHTAACRMAEAGIPMEEISQFLGHSNVRVTAAVYARYSPEHLRRAAKALELPGLRLVQ